MAAHVVHRVTRRTLCGHDRCCTGRTGGWGAGRWCGGPDALLDVGDPVAFRCRLAVRLGFLAAKGILRRSRRGRRGVDRRRGHARRMRRVQSRCVRRRGRARRRRNLTGQALPAFTVRHCPSCAARLVVAQRFECSVPFALKFVILGTVSQVRVIRHLRRRRRRSRGSSRGLRIGRRGGRRRGCRMHRHGGTRGVIRARRARRRGSRRRARGRNSGWRRSRGRKGEGRVVEVDRC